MNNSQNVHEIHRKVEELSEYKIVILNTNETQQN